MRKTRYARVHINDIDQLSKEGFTHCLKITQNVAFEFFNFGISTNFVLLKLTCLVTLFDRKLQVFKNSPKCTIFGIFN